ncbi:hypothetical protein CBL_08976 [Carabus blaptoides fortunei]
MATENVGAVKIDGYLEKKGKMKVVTTWKKYWFVLEGRLLLYYRSQEEYDKLSPCKGSINMGLATSIRPGLATAGVFQIITRTNTITLRAKERAIQEKWLQALLDASGQQTVTNPIKMSHFRYSMDDLIPASTKHQQATARTTDAITKRTVLSRQNTLPHRFKTTNTTAAASTHLDRSNTIIERIRQLGGQSYIGSLDTLNRLRQQPSDTRMAEEQAAHGEVSVRNDLYAAVLIENAEYVSAEVNQDKADHNENCYLIENDEYIRSDDVSNQRTPSSADSNPATMDDIEYYCTYEEINNLKAQLQSHIYNEPVLPPRDRKTDSDDCVSCGKEDKKKSSFMKFARRLTSFKTTDDGRRKRSTNLIMKVMGKKKNSNSSDPGVVVTEPIYDTVDYYEIDKANQQKQDALQLLKTLAELQQTLEAKKTKIKDIIVASSSSPTSKDADTQSTASTGAETSGDASSESLKDTATRVPQDTEQPVGPYPPGLPPRHGTRPRSPFHDVPRNNTPVHTPTSEYSIDKILHDLEQQSRQSTTVEELSVRALIDRFNQSAGEPVNACAPAPGDDATTNDVALRDKSTDVAMVTYTALTTAHRHSDELNKLLEELTKVTSAPLLTPGVTSSLVQMKSVPLTDEEWLAIAPIRRRRHSEPDYDVPRPHRSLQIIPRSPDTDDTEADTVIPATRFFGPVLPTYDKHSYPDVSIAWRSMTPDSLEPLQLMHVKRKVGQPDGDTVRDVLCATVGSEVSHFPANGGGVVESKSPDVFLDSLEPFTESATAF